jgi:hypothetical protein
MSRAVIALALVAAAHATGGVVSVPTHLKTLGVKNFADHATHNKSHFDSLQASDTTASHNATDDTWKPHIGERVRGFERCCNARDHTHGSMHTTCSLVTESHFDTETAKNVSHDMIKIKHKLGVAESRKTDEYNCQPDGSMVRGCRCCECINGAAVEENGQHASQVVLQLPTCRDKHNEVPKCKESTTICHHDKDGNELVYNPAPTVQKCQKCGDRHGRLACPKTGCSSKGAGPDFKSLTLNTIPGHGSFGKCLHCGGNNNIPCAGDQCHDGFALSKNGLRCYATV